ncbi:MULTISPECIES: protealysin inhibitor emfourin [unclassified Modicisalibacter]|uniref:protealysin inhibitor emfourin n=1 Tax=unclassified Modicisalibacter TaxID=2679913 RepID=UPI001CCE796F|nr:MULTISPECIES: protealysin inhibitor emfourin [unclassified Modicisalibacter]MBZ9557444.1 hypothetical protein [Modicisalibacter sp. R2A 31.J]MBZ9573890.1 hypothetical protein [Modicisalibacter sp. MOD 31.J]
MTACRPPLEPGSVVVIRREGGVARFPGLAAPRRLRCDDLSAAQRERLASLLAGLVETPAAPAGADRQCYHLAIERPDEGSPDGDGQTIWRLVLDETQTPEALIGLWRHGVLPEEFRRQTGDD